MAQMDTIIIADGEHRIRVYFVSGFEPYNDLHGRVIKFDIGDVTDKTVKAVCVDNTNVTKLKLYGHASDLGDTLNDWETGPGATYKSGEVTVSKDAIDGRYKAYFAPNVALRWWLLRCTIASVASDTTPVDTVWANPGDVLESKANLKPLAALLRVDQASLKKRLQRHKQREFLYLQRHVEPELAEKFRALKIPGVYLQREFRRYYPAGEVIAHVLGFTNVDDIGQEGMELALDEEITGREGSKRIIRDSHGRAVDDVERLRAAEPGKNIYLSIDRRLQYLAYRSLRAAVLENNAIAGDDFIRPGFASGVSATGEVLPGLHYKAVVNNNLSQIGLKAGQLTRDLAFGASLWWMPTTKEFGPRGAYGDWEYHQELATRFGVSSASMRNEDRYNPTSNPSPGRTQIRLGDSQLLFETGALADNVTVLSSGFRILSFDAGFKYKGFFFQTEFHNRWLDNFQADGPLPVSSIVDRSFYIQTAFYPIPKTLELYAATSHGVTPYAFTFPS